MAMNASLELLARTCKYLYLSRRPGASVPILQKKWAHETLDLFNIHLTVKGRQSSTSPLILVGNHISYLDIPLLMATVDDVSFVAKKELAAWPVFGTAARALNTIFVSRGCQNSRSETRDAIAEGLRQNRRIVVFPSGTTCLDETRIWRRGIFEIAHATKTPIQPFRLTYSPLRKAAYIDDDFFPSHIWSLSREKDIAASLEFHAPFAVEHPAQDCARWQEWTQPRVWGPEVRGLEAKIPDWGMA